MLHDWTKADPGHFRHLHGQWLAEMCNALNGGVLPKGYYALNEQYAGLFSPDVLAYQTKERTAKTGNSSTATLPRADSALRADPVRQTRPQRRLVVHTKSQPVAVIELVSPGNKDRRKSVKDFSTKVAVFIANGVNAVVLDILPSRRHDPNGMHAAVWALLAPQGPPAEPPPVDRPITFVGYDADRSPVAYLSYTAVGRPLPDVPLYLEGDEFVMMPVASTYTAVYERLPDVLKEELAAG